MNGDFDTRSRKVGVYFTMSVTVQRSRLGVSSGRVPGERIGEG